MPLQQTSGNVTADAYGGTGGVSVIPNYIEDVFSTWLYTGNGATQTITNGIDLAGKGGLTWIKSRSNAVSHAFTDTARGVGRSLSSNTTGAQSLFYNDELTAFNSTGFTLGADVNQGIMNLSGQTYASWTFREQPKFFDVVTYTGDASNPKTIAHSLGSVPGCIIIKRTDTTGDWWTYHNSITVNQYLKLNTTAAVATSTAIWGTGPTTTSFTVNAGALNAAGGTYVAYIFAHNAGGFGLTGTDNVISCGSFTTDASGNATVNLGYEPQWLMDKDATGATNWYVLDTMRGWNQTGNNLLLPNTSAAEAVIATGATPWTPTATGFIISGYSASRTHIYIAIRRGPMKVPTDGTKVFAPVKVTATSTTIVTTNFPVDSCWNSEPNAIDSGFKYTFDRLRGGSLTQQVYLITSLTNPEANSAGSGLAFDSNVSIVDNYWGTAQAATSPIIYWNFRRAPGFFDEVCYTGTGVATTVAHNLAAVPELVIVKKRAGTSATSWLCYVASLGNTVRITLNTDGPVSGASNTFWNNTTPTASVFSIGTNDAVNISGDTYVAYLFATCPGVSKVGSYTGNGTTQAIACGFAGGARFVLIKRTDSTGDWYTYDTARGMTTLTDPYLLMNSTAAEAATLGSVTTTTGGFTVNATVLAAINTNAASYIFLAIS